MTGYGLKVCGVVMTPEDPLMAGILALVATLGGLVVWVVRRTFSHTIPRLAKDFKEALNNLNDLFREEMKAAREEAKEQREDFRQELRAEREESRSALDAHGKRIDELAQSHIGLAAEVRAARDG